VLPIKHSKEQLGKGLEAYPTAFPMQYLGSLNKEILIPKVIDLK
jgi:hypothetical protein